MYVSSSAPSRRSLVFAFSLNNNVLGGNFTYVVLTAVVCVGLCIAAQLPKNTWKPAEK